MRRGRKAIVVRTKKLRHSYRVLKGKSRQLKNSTDRNPSVCQFVGYKNSGKTTLICALIPLLKQLGHTVAVIKHDAHDFFHIDLPETDTWRQREAGASGIAITSASRTTRMEERGSGLSELIASFGDYDYILIEGFKSESYPKFVMIHENEDLRLLYELSNVIAAVVWPPMMDEAMTHRAMKIPYFYINDSVGIANYLWRQCI